jgi:hypothetical protein
MNGTHRVRFDAMSFRRGGRSCFGTHGKKLGPLNRLEKAVALESISCDCINRWRKGNREFCEAVKKAEAERLRRRLTRIEAGEQGWQGTAWALERIYPHRFARPEVMNQIAVVNQEGKASAERVIVLPGEEFDALIGRPGYHQRNNGDLERREGSLVYVIVRQQSNWALSAGK